MDRLPRRISRYSAKSILFIHVLPSLSVPLSPHRWSTTTPEPLFRVTQAPAALVVGAFFFFFSARPACFRRFGATDGDIKITYEDEELASIKRLRSRAWGKGSHFVRA